MIRSLIFASMVLGVLAPAVFADADLDKFLKRAEKVNEGVADAHVKLARWCFRRGLNENAYREITLALEVVPEYEKAMKEIGYARKRVDGERQWVLDEDKAPPREDHPDADPNDHIKYVKERGDVYRGIADEFVRLGEYAVKLELEAHARAVFSTALKYDPVNETALKGAGWVRDAHGDWISPEEAKEREQDREALENVPEGETVEALPEWTNGVFGNDAAGMKFGNVTVISAVGRHNEAGRYAHAACALVREILGGDEEDLRVVLAGNAAQHKAYVEARHPAIPGLAQDQWILGRSEIEVLLGDDDLGMEHVVYAATVYEVRRRCGEVRHPWFEIGMATNMTARLMGSVKTAQFFGEPAGPTEPGRWKRTLKMLVGEDTQPAVAELTVERDPDENEVILAHFFTRYLTRKRTAALGAFCRAYKADGDVEAAFRSAFDEDSSALEKQFLAWFAMS